MRKILPEQEKQLNHISDTIKNVSHNFHELDQFTGRFLRHIYDHKRAADQDYIDEGRYVAGEVRKAPPIFSAHEQRKRTL